MPCLKLGYFYEKSVNTCLLIFIEYICVNKCLPIMETRRDVFQAIADPTRRQIIGLLAKAPMNLNAITEHFELTRPAISNHIKILQECGVIEVEQIGRERYCKIQADHLKMVADWIAQYT